MNIKKFKKGVKSKLSKNFASTEFDCSCKKCTETLIDLDHIIKLQKLRDDLGSSIKINSGYRCPEHNANIGGAKQSQHVLGTATDIVVKDMAPDEVADSCEYFKGLGRYDSFTHIDSRDRISKARWDNRSKKEHLPKGPSNEEIDKMLQDIEDDLLK